MKLVAHKYAAEVNLPFILPYSIQVKTQFTKGESLLEITPLSHQDTGILISVIKLKEFDPFLVC